MGGAPQGWGAIIWRGRLRTAQWGLVGGGDSLICDSYT